MRGEIARYRALPALRQALDERRQERPAAGAERGVEQHHAFVERRVAFEAVADRRQVGTAARLVLHVGVGEAAVGDGERLALDRRAIDRHRQGIAHRRQRAQIDDDGVEVARQDGLEEVGGHRRAQRLAGERPALGALAVRDRALDLGVAPGADAGLPVGRDVRGEAGVRRNVEADAAAGELLAGDRSPFAVLGCVAIAAGQDRRHQVAAALERRALRQRRRHGAGERKGDQQDANDRRCGIRVAHGTSFGRAGQSVGSVSCRAS